MVLPSLDIDMQIKTPQSQPYLIAAGLAEPALRARCVNEDHYVGGGGLTCPDYEISGCDSFHESVPHCSYGGTYIRG
jgi:hypothetical protein